MDAAIALATDMITVCPLIDGLDHPFQVDYRKQWAWMVEAFGEASAHRQDVRISIEYKAYESAQPHRPADHGADAALLRRGRGKEPRETMDVGHAFIAGETPAAEVYASVTPPAGSSISTSTTTTAAPTGTCSPPRSISGETLETLYYMGQLGWDGWVAYDVFTRVGDNAEAVAATFQIMEDMQKLIARIGWEELTRLRDDGTPARVFAGLIHALV